MGLLILLRHGQSVWNKENLFTGWVDIPLSPEGIQEALTAGDEIKNIPIDIIFSSSLMRGMMTAFLAMSRQPHKTAMLVHPKESKMGQWGHCYSKETAHNLIPMYAHFELNERMYGELQGLNKQKTREKYGEDQVHIWRRSYDIAPPKGESLKMTAERTLPFFKETILPQLEEGKTVFISAHGNSLRSIVMYIDQLSESEVLKLEIPTGKPLYYAYEKGQFRGHRP